jgi:hypothetical protein
VEVVKTVSEAIHLKCEVCPMLCKTHFFYCAWLQRTFENGEQMRDLSSKCGFNVVGGGGDVLS